MKDPILYDFVMIFYVFSIFLSPSNREFSLNFFFLTFGSVCINHHGWHLLVDLICTKKSHAKLFMIWWQHLNHISHECSCIIVCNTVSARLLETSTNYPAGRIAGDIYVVLLPVLPIGSSLYWYKYDPSVEPYTTWPDIWSLAFVSLWCNTKICCNTWHRSSWTSSRTGNRLAASAQWYAQSN